MISATALILTYNEEENIGRTLAAMSWIGEVVIVDSGSTDRTLEIARSSHPKLRILQRTFDSHANQWNFGLAQIHTPWVLTLDADYEVSAALAEEIQQLAPEEIAGYEAQFQYRIHGRPLRSSVYPPRVVVLRIDRASYFDEGHTQRLRIDGTVRMLTGLIYHDDRKSLRHWLQSQQRYALLEARHILTTDPSRRTTPDRLRSKIVLAAPAMLFYLMFGRGLILEGWPGWFYVSQRTIAELLLSVHLLREKVRNSKPGK